MHCSSEKEIWESVKSIRRFWVRKTEPWLEERRDSKRVERRVRNYVVSDCLCRRTKQEYLVRAEMTCCHSLAQSIWRMGPMCSGQASSME